MLKLAGRGLAGLGRAAGIFEKEAHLARTTARLGRTEQRVAQVVKVEQEAAKLYSNSVRLAQQLASEAQMAEARKIIIEASQLKAAHRLAQRYGGHASDWVKKTSKSVYKQNGRVFETHWYENLATGRRVEYKVKLKGW